MSNAPKVENVVAPSVEFSHEAWEKYMIYASCKVGPKPVVQKKVKGKKNKNKGKDNKVTSFFRKPGSNYYSQQQNFYGQRSGGFVEISGFGLVKLLDNGVFHIYDMLLMHSEGTGASTEIDSSKMAKTVQELMDQDKFEAIEDMKLWWHTHPSGMLSWSGTDLGQMKKLGEFGWDWGISVVTDGSRKARIRLDIWRPFRSSFDNVPFHIANPQDKEELKLLKSINALQTKLTNIRKEKTKALKEELQEEVYEKVKRKTYNTVKSGYRSTPGNVGGFKSQKNLKYGIPLPDECDKYSKKGRLLLPSLGDIEKMSDEDAAQYLDILKDIEPEDIHNYMDEEDQKILKDPHGVKEQ